MNEKSKAPRTAKFQGNEVTNGQEVKVPRHKIVNSLGEGLLDFCPSTTGYIVFTGGAPVIVPMVNCKNKENQTCFKSWK